MTELTRIYVRGLPPNLTVEEFRKHFSRPAPITDAKFIPHRRIGYVGYKTPEDAARSIKYHNKSFIRMSRIAVELARPIENQKSSRQREHDAGEGSGGSNGVANPNFKEQEKQQPKGQDGNDTQTSEAGPKLEEFLEVMRPVSKSKVWEEHGATDIYAPQAVQPEKLEQTPAEEKEDLEYDELPKKRRKLSKDTQPPMAVEQEKTQEKTLVEAGEVEKEQSPQQVFPAASDEDWLRSRTKRTLDLVEADELAQRDDQRILEPGATTQSSNINPISRSPSLSGDRVAANDPSENDELVHGSGTGVTHASNRLFLRNLPYLTTEDEIKLHIQDQGLDGLVEVSSFYYVTPQIPQTMPHCVMKT